MGDGARRYTGGIERGPQIEIQVDGRPVPAFEGETVATALTAAGIQTLRWTHRREEPRGLFCGMGVCFDCVVTIDGVPNVRSCVTPVAPGMKVSLQRGLPEVTLHVAD
jgi:predicted molibdopterin-dependent oxidoreductase YjgC